MNYVTHFTYPAGARKDVNFSFKFRNQRLIFIWKASLIGFEKNDFKPFT